MAAFQIFFWNFHSDIPGVSWSKIDYFSHFFRWVSSTTKPDWMFQHFSVPKSGFSTAFAQRIKRENLEVRIFAAKRWVFITNVRSFLFFPLKFWFVSHFCFHPVFVGHHFERPLRKCRETFPGCVDCYGRRVGSERRAKFSEGGSWKP